MVRFTSIVLEEVDTRGPPFHGIERALVWIREIFYRLHEFKEDGPPTLLFFVVRGTYPI